MLLSLLSKAQGAAAWTPLATCWPMGSSWASHVAQSTMVAAAKDAGISHEQLLHAHGALPTPSAPTISIATDDVILFERASPDAENDPGGVEGRPESCQIRLSN